MSQDSTAVTQLRDAGGLDQSGSSGDEKWSDCGHVGKEVGSTRFLNGLDTSEHKRSQEWLQSLRPEQLEG